MHEHSETSKKHAKKNRLPLIISMIAVVIVGALATTTFLLYRQVQDLRDDPSKVVTEQADQLKNKVAKIMQLPDETPAVITIKDVDKLKSQEDFFKDANNGDKILVFSVARKAVIYRESDNKVINAGPIVINTSSTAETN
jgi:heme/copper-type cytochrome/quinol oxidase subunit 2